MALTADVQLLNSLPEVVLCGNKIPLKFQASSNLIENAGSKAEVILPWTAVAVADEYFDLTLKGEIVRFTCKAAPDNSGVQFHDNSLGHSLNSWVALLAEDIKKNYLVARYYDVTATSGSITIISKTTGADYSLDFTAGAGIDCIPTLTNKTGTNKTLRAFYNIVLLVYSRYTLVTELALNVDEEGLAETNIEDLLKADLKQDFEWPESDSMFIFDCPSAIAPFYFMYGEKWGDGEYKSMTKSNTYYVIDGGVSWMQLAKYNINGKSFWAKLLYNNYFLSWAPLSRNIAPTEPVKLYFLNHTAATTLKLKAKLYTASSNSTITIEEVSAVEDKSIYEMVLTPDKVGFEGLSDKTLVKFEAWVDNESNARISEIRTFVLDYSYYEHTRYFMFRNSLGAFECLRTTGLMAIAGSYTREVASVDMDSDYLSKERAEISVSNAEQQKFTLAMGWLNRYSNADEYRNWLRDFSLSKEIYQIIGSTLKPIRITSDNMDGGKDRDTTKGFVFEFVNAYTDEYFTKDIAWNLFNNDFEIIQ